MNILNEAEAQCHFRMTDAYLAWTDLERARYYRRILQRSHIHLDKLNQHSLDHAEHIALENTILSGIHQELKRLERRLSEIRTHQ